jgi:hypothetical protein
MNRPYLKPSLTPVRAIFIYGRNGTIIAIPASFLICLAQAADPHPARTRRP